MGLLRCFMGRSYRRNFPAHHHSSAICSTDGKGGGDADLITLAFGGSAAEWFAHALSLQDVAAAIALFICSKCARKCPVTKSSLNQSSCFSPNFTCCHVISKSLSRKLPNTSSRRA